MKFDVMRGDVQDFGNRVNRVRRRLGPGPHLGFFPGAGDRHHRVQRFHLGMVDIIRLVFCRVDLCCIIRQGGNIAFYIPGETVPGQVPRRRSVLLQGFITVEAAHSFHFMPGDFKPVTGFQGNRVAGGDHCNGFRPFYHVDNAADAVRVLFIDGA